MLDSKLIHYMKDIEAKLENTHICNSIDIGNGILFTAYKKYF
jgi:hypothetical protein